MKRGETKGPHKFLSRTYSLVVNTLNVGGGGGKYRKVANIYKPIYLVLSALRHRTT